MKKIIIIFFIIQVILFSACNKIDDENESTEILELEENETLIEDSSLFKELNEIYALERMDEILLRKITEEQYLVGFQEKFDYQMNPTFHIYDYQKKESKPIDGQLEYIDEIRIENSTIDFFSKGTNIMNGFRVFPNISTVDLETGHVNNQSVYSRIGSNFKPFYMGNFMNETNLKDLIIAKSGIIFDFSVSENSLLAGGNHCPNISVISKSENNITIDVENLIIEEAVRNTFGENAFIDEINVSSYIDGRNINHKVLSFELEVFNEYTCNFEMGSDGIMDLIVSYK